MNNGIPIEYASHTSPSPNLNWQNFSEKKRISIVELVINGLAGGDAIEVKNAFSDGQVIIYLNKTMTASERGVFLLDFEDLIKKELDNGITIWHDSIGDKNSLRNLRGIEIVSIGDDE